MRQGDKLDREGLGAHLYMENRMGPSEDLNREMAEAPEMAKMLSAAVPGVLLGLVIPAVVFYDVMAFLLPLSFLGSLFVLLGLRRVARQQSLLQAAFVLAAVLTALNGLRLVGSLLPGDLALLQTFLGVFGWVAAAAGLGLLLCLCVGVARVQNAELLPALLPCVFYAGLLALTAVAYSPVMLGVKAVLALGAAWTLIRFRKLAIQ